jgi:hypothetical protein
MKRIVIIIGLTLVSGLGLMAAAVMAQGPGFVRGFGMGPGYGRPEGPIAPLQPKGACRFDPSITFTEEQTKEFENLQSAFPEEGKPLWSEMRNLRIELRFAVSDPQVPPQALLDKQRRFSALQARLENLLFSYQVKARAIFTKEQLERFPAGCPLKMGLEYGVKKGMGRGRQKGIH